MREGADCDERDRDGSREKSESEKKVERFGCEDFRRHPNLGGTETILVEPP